MFDARRLLDQFLGSISAPEGESDSVGRPADTGQGSLRQQAESVIGQVNQLARNNPLLAGGAAGGLAALLLGSKAGRKLGGNLVKLGGLAAIGGIAYKAYQDYQARQAGGASAPQQASVPVLPPPSESGFSPANAPQGAASLAETLIVAMVAAAKADGHIDAEERGRIYGHLEQGGLDAGELAFLRAELDAEPDIERLVKAATTPEIAAEIYAASVLAIRADTPQEQAWLSTLSARLNIPQGLADAITDAVSDASVKT